MRRFDRVPLTLVVVMCAACARPTTPVSTAVPKPAVSEQLRQQQLVLGRDLRQQQRVDDVGHALLVAATPFCGSALAPRVGVRFATVHSFSREFQEAARSLGFSDTLMIVGVARGSTAAQSGFSLGDRVRAVDGVPAPVGPDAVSMLARAFADRPNYPPRLTLEQGDIRFLSDGVWNDDPAASAPRPGGQVRVAMPADTGCAFSLVTTRQDEVNAWADGANVAVTAGMLRFAADDDDLAVVLAHEIAHNAMRHVQAQHTNAALGGQFGAIIDIATASQSANTNGELSNLAGNGGATPFSSEQEHEADHAGMYVLSRAGLPVARMPDFWRRIVLEKSGSVKYASAHPATDDRFVRLEQDIREMEQKIARGDALLPELRRESPPPAKALAQSPSKAPQAKRAAPSTASVLVDRGRALTLVEVPKYRPPPPTPISSAGDVAVISTTTITRPDSVSYTFGPPMAREGLTVAQVRQRAREAFDDGREALELRLYQRAEDRFRQAAYYDGSEARYHAALGAILLKRGKRVEAETVLTAAVLLDVENADYRQLLLEARKHD